VVHAHLAIRPDAPKVVAEENNLQEKGKNGDPQKAEAAFATADAIVEGEYITARIHHACLETHGMVVDYRGGDTATIYASTQGTFTIHGDARKSWDSRKRRDDDCRTHGRRLWSKFGLGLEGMLACRLSKQTKSPVKLMFTRYDEFVMAGNRSGSWQKLKAGVKNDGTIVALQARQYRLGGLGRARRPAAVHLSHGRHVSRVYALHTTKTRRSRCARPVIRRRRSRLNHSSTSSPTRSRWIRSSFA
jgi:xanthine dehydrogenase YagR molybdenum-binding subunit